ncbi:hypothetical protein M5E88_08480 [Akkermansia muciniphila]|nr:hypothetical protein M5E88_08480 [Akkermansia muciniphila]
MTDYPFVLLGKTGQAPSFLLMGDSHAMASSPGLTRPPGFFSVRACSTARACVR